MEWIVVRKARKIHCITNASYLLCFQSSLSDFGVHCQTPRLESLVVSCHICASPVAGGHVMIPTWTLLWSSSAFFLLFCFQWCLNDFGVRQRHFQMARLESLVVSCHICAPPVTGGHVMIPTWTFLWSSSAFFLLPIQSQP